MVKSTGKKTIQSIERMAEILDYLSSKPRGERLTTISKELLLNKSTAFGIISTLEQLNYVEQDQETGKYVLGLKLFELGQASYTRLDLVSVAKPHISRLSEKYEETVHIAVLSGSEVVYLDKVESSRSMRVSSQIGVRQPVYCTALGKALAAYLPEKEIMEVAQNTDFIRYTASTITTQEALIKELKRVKALGYSVDNEESELGLYCVSAPVFNGEMKVIAAISMAGTVERIKKEGGQKLIDDIVETASIISTNMGYK